MNNGSTLLDMTCPVCFELTTDVLECGHSLCHICAARWFARHTTCPSCRKVVQDAAHFRTDDTRDDDDELGDWRIVADDPDELLLHGPDRIRGVSWSVPQVYFGDPIGFGNVGFTLQHYNGPPRGIRVRYLTTTYDTVREYGHFLQNDDVITHINGYRVGNPETVYDELSRAMEDQSWLICTILHRNHTTSPS